MAPGDGSGPTPSESQSQSQSQPRSGGGGDGSRGRGRGGRGKGNQNRRGGRRGRGGNNNNAGETPASPAAQDVAAAASRAHALAAGKEAAAGDDDDAEVCFICANPVAHTSIAPCNHTTCHICGLRMRALYKTKDCAHCRTPADFVIFTNDPEKRFEDYTASEITTTDTNIGIKYANEDIVGDTVLLLRYNCPDDSCDFAGLGWPDLHRHVKSVHHKRMCDLCTRNKKVFTHEHELFGDRELEKHMRHGDHKPGASDQSGFKGHPLCGFCGERFYDDDKLYEHCRMKHERCFICDRQDSRKPHYYQDYNALEQHFKKDHYLCSDRECMEKKFVVFESELDLQAHQLSEHGGKTVGRDARVVDISGFDYRQSYQHEQRGGRNEGRGGRNRGRGRDPNAEPTPVSSAQPLRRDEIAFQRQMAIHSAQSVSNRTFGGQLSTPAPAPTPAAPTPSSASQPRSGASNSSTPRASQNDLTAATQQLTVTDTSNLSPEERARMVRHNSVIERASNLLGNDTRKMNAFRGHITSYRQGGFTSPQLVDAFFTLFADVSSNALGTLVREVADLFEDKKKADGLRQAWQDWRAINEDYPSLPGLSGMQGATSSSSGWASAATASPGLPNAAPSQKHSNRVLKLKNSTRLGPAPVSPQVNANWGATPARKPPAASASAFPSLPSASAAASAGSSNAGSSSASSSRPSWNTGSAAQTSQSAPPLNNRPRNNKSGEDSFPALPAAPKPQTTIFGYGSGRLVHRDYGQRETGFQWGGSSSAAAEEPAEEADEGTGKGKGKKNKKKVLVQWG